MLNELVSDVFHVLEIFLALFNLLLIVGVQLLGLFDMLAELLTLVL